MSTEYVAAILGEDPAPFRNLLYDHMSSSKKKRSAAKKLFNRCKETDPETFILKLGQFLKLYPDMKVRAMAANLLRKHLPPDSLPWELKLKLFSPEWLPSVKLFLITCLKNEEEKSIRKTLCNTISTFGKTILPYDRWPELSQFMFQCVSSDSTKLQESAFLIFALMEGYVKDSLAPHITHIHSGFLQCLTQTSSSDVSIAALKGVKIYFRCFYSSCDEDRFQELLPGMMRTVTEALNGEQEATAQKALKLLTELATEEPRFFRRQIVEVVGTMLQIAEAETLKEGTRLLAIHFVITLAEAREKAPGMIRKLPQFISWLFAILMRMLLDVEDEHAWHSAEEENEDAGESRNYKVIKVFLDRLAKALGGNTIVSAAYGQLTAYLAAPEWQKGHAALITLRQIAEECSKAIIRNLKQVVTMVLDSFQHPHPRVRWAAISAIAQLSTVIVIRPHLQVQYHQLVLPALALAMDDFQNPRVQAYAVIAVVEFSRKCAPDILTPYMKRLFGKLCKLLQNDKQMVQESSLTAIASIAYSSGGEHFQKYYDTVMPYLKTLLVNANDKANRMIRAKAMECISVVGIAVGKEKFKNDAKQVMEVLCLFQGPQLESDDPTTTYMIKAWTRLCMCLGQDFLPYVSVVMPPLIQKLMFKFEYDKKSIKTIDAQVCKAACELVYFCASDLKEGFYPWIEQVAPVTVRLLTFYIDSEVRKKAISAMPELLHTAKLALDKGLAKGNDRYKMKELFHYIIQSLVEALHEEDEIEIILDLLYALNQCIQVSEPLIDKQIRSVLDEINLVLIASSSRKRERAERTTIEDFDAEEGELLKEEDEQEEEIFYYVSRILKTLFETLKCFFLPFFDELSSYIVPMLGKDKTAEERRIAIIIFDYLVEYCNEAALKYYDTYLPFVLEACNDENPGVRQAAVYGLSLCAERGGSVIRPLIGEVLLRINVVIRHPNALHSANVLAYDNAVSALGKVCQFHRDSIDSAQVIPAWLSCLPIKEDLVEAKYVHDLLCSMVERSDTELLGPNNQYLPKIVSVFAEILGAGTDLATEETINRIINVLKQLQQTLPPATMALAWSSLQPQQHLTLQSVLSS